MRQWTLKERKRQACVMRRVRPWRGSTGPRTKAGKEASKYNATKHGNRSAAFIRMRKALAAQSAYLKAVNDVVKAGFPLCAGLRDMGRHVTNELLSATLNFCDPPPIVQAKIIQFSAEKQKRGQAPPDMRRERQAA